ncbi:hypothetical protein CkaCkLH20_02886 [Colletotrichum karsti]|uniref:Uncharacterized protein n=1 Tax=Colletotrichum karsti TaxID=1095194 RepID=A0A9P6LMZ3_9PEZI|nr:uncharacterized protein CkaCkLH20_02886 [Colletotrichum karsti]KAF9879343.1 hypothetical protein CkaCkLH20_02886 [Colletotrichum karsti]
MRVTTALAAAASLASVATAQHNFTDAELQESIRISADHGLNLALKADKADAADADTNGRTLCNCSTNKNAPAESYKFCLRKLFNAHPEVPADFPRDPTGAPLIKCTRTKTNALPSVSFAKREIETGGDGGESGGPEEVNNNKNKPRQLVAGDVLQPPNLSEEEYKAIVDMRMSFYCPDVDFPELEHHCRSKISAALPDYPEDYPRDKRGLPADSALLSEEEAGALEKREQGRFDIDGFGDAVTRGCEIERRMAAYCPEATDECRKKMREVYPEYPEDYPRNRLGMRKMGNVPAKYQQLCKGTPRVKPESDKTIDTAWTGFW